MTKLIILILRRCFARSSLPLRASNSMFRFCVKSPVDTESSTDNSEDELNCVDTCDDDMPVAEKTGNVNTDIYMVLNSNRALIDLLEIM